MKLCIHFFNFCYIRRNVIFLYSLKYWHDIIYRTLKRNWYDIYLNIKSQRNFLMSERRYPFYLTFYWRTLWLHYFSLCPKMTGYSTDARVASIRLFKQRLRVSINVPISKYHRSCLVRILNLHVRIKFYAIRLHENLNLSAIFRLV